MISGCCGSSKLNPREFVGGFDGLEIACGHRYRVDAVMIPVTDGITIVRRK